MEMPQKYVILVRASSIDQAVEETLHLAYIFLVRAIQEHRARGRNGEYEDFAMELLAFLQRTRRLYTLEP